MVVYWTFIGQDGKKYMLLMNEKRWRFNDTMKELTRIE